MSIIGDLLRTPDKIQHLERRMSRIERDDLTYKSLRQQIQSLHRICSFLADQNAALCDYLNVVICYDLDVDVNGHYVARPVEEVEGGEDDNRD